MASIFAAMALDDLQNLSLLWCCEFLELFAQVIRHPVRGKARIVARGEPPAVKQVKMIASHALTDEAGDEGNDDDHDGRHAGVT